MPFLWFGVSDPELYFADAHAPASHFAWESINK